VRVLDLLQLKPNVHGPPFFCLVPNVVTGSHIEPKANGTGVHRRTDSQLDGVREHKYVSP
jgi:hypothetical protein